MHGRKRCALLMLAGLLWCLAIMPVPAYAFYNRGELRLTLGAASVTLPVNATATVSAVITPSSFTGTVGCGRNTCPQITCRDDAGNAMNCGDEVTGQCPCAGSAMTTTEARVTVKIDKTLVVSAYYSMGNVHIKGLSAGTAAITLDATLTNEFKDSPPRTITVTVTEPINVQPSFSPPPDLPEWTPTAGPTPPAAISRPSIPPSQSGGTSPVNTPADFQIPTLAPSGGGIPNTPSQPSPAPTQPGSNGINTPIPSASSGNPFAGIPQEREEEQTGRQQLPQTMPSAPIRQIQPTGGGGGQPGMGGNEGQAVQGTGGAGGDASETGQGRTEGGAGNAPSNFELEAITPPRDSTTANSHPPTASPPSAGNTDQAGEMESDQEKSADDPPQEGPTIIVVLDEEGPTGKAELEQAKRENGRVIFQKLDEEQNVLYSWSFRGTDIINPADIDMRIDFPEALPGQEQPTGLIDPFYMVFAHRGPLPGTADIYIRMDSSYESGSILTLYERVEAQEKLQDIAGNLPVKDGYASFELDRIGEAYALAAGETEAMPRQWAVLISVVLFVMIGGFIAAAAVNIVKRRKALKGRGEEEQ